MRGSRLLLVGTIAGASCERIATLSPFASEPASFGFLYTTEAPECIAAAERIGDRLWLSPRRQVGLGTPRAWLELLRSHRHERVVAVVPAATLELDPSTLCDSLAGTRCARWPGAATFVLELSLPAEDG
jgi:hypothetical protein